MMNPKRGDLEFVYNLLWKTKPQQCSDDKSNIIGMYDVPGTTNNWNTFKAYLLKNSGCSSSDIKVSYVDSNGKEQTIKSQADFQVALHTFRCRARVGEIITLRLEKINDRKKLFAKRKNDVQIQVQPMVENNSNTTQTYEITTKDISTSANETPPEWFLTYMTKFKAQLMDEINESIQQMTIKTRESSGSSNIVYPRRSKSETHKRLRKYQVDITKNIERELAKHSKMEHKLESKLEKLEQKTMKIKAKKLALNRNEFEMARSLSKRLIGIDNYENHLMDAQPVHPPDVILPHMNGGETFLQEWKVTNSGKMKWDANTELRYAWGSEQLVPIEKCVLCPELNPGEEGTVSVLLDIPSQPGHYECYWHFYHNGRRFGHWVGCTIVVDAPVQKTPPVCCYNTSIESNINNHSLKLISDTTVKMQELSLQSQPESANILIATCEEKCCGDNKINDGGIETDKQPLNLLPRQSNDILSSDSDNISVISLSGSNSGSSRFDYVLINENNQAGGGDCIENNATANEECQKNDDDDIKITENNDSDFAYVVYNGEKYPFHKKYLRDDFYEQAEKVPIKETMHTPIKTPVTNSNADLNNSEPSTSSSSNRLFVFPQYSPGFEVVYPHMIDTEEEKILMGEESKEMDYSNLQDSFFSLTSSAPESTTHGSVEHPENDDEDYVPRVIGVDVPSITSGHSTHSQSTHRPMVDCYYYNSASSLHQSGRCSPYASLASPCNPNNFSPTSITTSTVYTSPAMDNVPSSANQAGQPVSTPVTTATTKRENIITNAAILASSAMCTARNMMNMVIQGNEKWVNGHCVSFAPNSKREKALNTLAEMGFNNRDLNITLLTRYDDDIMRVITELLP